MGGLKIVVAGCVAAQEGETLLRRVPELDLVLGPHHANRCASQHSATACILTHAIYIVRSTAALFDKSLSS